MFVGVLIKKIITVYKKEIITAYQNQVSEN